jgi:O-acetyl-ADP-ribose deacetylase (regulator of RNase III)
MNEGTHRGYFVVSRSPARITFRENDPLGRVFIYVKGPMDNRKVDSKESIPLENENTPFPPDVLVIDGDLLESGIPVIAHQCNCVTTRGAGLAASMFAKYPYSDIYSKKILGVRVPGEIRVCYPPEEGPIVVNLLAQFKPGKPKESETKAVRLAWFRQTLLMLGKFMTTGKHTLVGMPYNIGCGLAGGDWKDYLRQIQAFSAQFGIKVRLYKL